MPQARHYVDEGSDVGGAVRCHAARYSETDDPRKSDMEARAGIEPAYTDLQSAASPLRHRASPAISRELGCYLRNRRSAIRKVLRRSSSDRKSTRLNSSHYCATRM